MTTHLRLSPTASRSTSRACGASSRDQGCSSCGGGRYAALLDGAALDAWQFEQLADAAAAAAAAGDRERAVTASTAALSLWRGPIVADIPLGSTGDNEAKRLEELRLRTLEVRFDAELALGRHDEAVGELQAAVGRHPYRERFVSQLMLALYRSGRQADALEVYERTRRRLGDELGLRPGAELQQLSARIVRQEPELQSSMQRQPSAPGRRDERGGLDASPGSSSSAPS